MTALSTLKNTVEAAREAFQDALRSAASDRTINRKYETLAETEAKLKAAREKRAAIEAERAKIEDQAKAESRQREIEKCRTAVSARLGELSAAAADLETKIAEAASLYKECGAAADRAFNAMHPSDRSKAAERAKIKFGDRLPYSTMLALTANGIRALADTSTVREHLKTMSPKTAVADLTRALDAHDA